MQVSIPLSLAILKSEVQKTFHSANSVSEKGVALGKFVALIRYGKGCRLYKVSVLSLFSAIMSRKACHMLRSLLSS